MTNTSDLGIVPGAISKEIVIPVVLFDFDNTIASTSSILDIRERRAYDELNAETMKDVLVYKPVPALLDGIRRTGAKLGIVTNSGRGYLAPVLEHLGLGNTFDTVVTYTDVKAEGMKPSKKGILLALEQLGLTASPEILFVGDDYVDHVAAYRAGVTPIMPSWATRKAVSMAPALEMNSEQLLDYLVDPGEYKLFAERCAELGRADYRRKGVYFLPLDDSANVVTLKDEMTGFCLGRYYSQKGAVTSWLHEQHALSKEIQAKEDAEQFEAPEHWCDLLVHTIRNAPGYLFDGQQFDLVTVIPAKQGKDARLERLLDRIAKKMKGDANCPTFIPNIFYFVADAQSQKSLRRDERSFEANRSLQLNPSMAAQIAGKRMLVIDDVTTTGATLARGRALGIVHGGAAVFGVALAKTVSIMEDERACPVCSRTMKVRRNGTTGEHFWGCTGYGASINPCNHAEPLVKKSCPKCERPMRIQTVRKTGVKFWSCTGWQQTPSCNFSMDMVPEDIPE